MAMRNCIFSYYCIYFYFYDEVIQRLECEVMAHDGGSGNSYLLDPTRTDQTKNVAIFLSYFFVPPQYCAVPYYSVPFDFSAVCVISLLPSQASPLVPITRHINQYSTQVPPKPS